MSEQRPGLTDDSRPYVEQRHDLTAEAVLQCQFSSWFDRFRRLRKDDTPLRRSNVTIKSIVLQDLPSNFIDYLLEDGVRLPLGCKASSNHVSSNSEHDSWWSDDEDIHAHDQDEDDEVDAPKEYDFPDLTERINTAIKELGGKVMPKLNWSAPRDAIWMNEGSLQCKTAGDVYLLLKSSDFVMHDVLHALDGTRESEQQVSPRDCSDSVKYELVLRKWCNLHPSMEFRCFVHQQTFVAISQRQHTQHFSHLVRDQYLIRSQLVEFFGVVVRERFPLQNYVFDVYVDQRERVWLVDFNVWSQQTDGLLWGWEELESLVASRSASDNNNDLHAYPDIRVVETPKEVHYDPLSSYRGPIDAVEIAGMTGGDKSNFEEFIKRCSKPSEMS